MEGSPFLPLPEGLLIASVEQTDPRLTVTVISLRPEAICPGCGHPSEHIHSQYRRIVHDVPSGGRQVVLCLHVRKFFCLHLCCSRKVFAERLPDLAQPWGRCSNRLLEALKAIGLAASAEVSERLTPQLAMPVKSSTLLRYLRTIPDPPRTNVSSLGIDDFALKRGDKYGTILINALTGKPLDLLADRTTEAVSPWLASHPEMEAGKPGPGQRLCGGCQSGLASRTSSGRQISSRPKPTRSPPAVPGPKAHLFTFCRRSPCGSEGIFAFSTAGRGLN